MGAVRGSRRRGDGADMGRGGLGALKVGRLGCDGVARPERPSRCTLPITALRVTPPSCLAIWLAERPSSQSFFNNSTRSSVQPIGLPPAARRRVGSAQHMVPVGPTDEPSLLDIVNCPL